LPGTLQRSGRTPGTAGLGPGAGCQQAADARIRSSVMPVSPIEPSAFGRLTLSGDGHGTSLGPGPGTHRLGLASRRDGVLFVPAITRPPIPLLVMLHGSAGNGLMALDLVRSAAETHGVVVLAPDSLKITWDVLLDRFGPDVRFIERALERTFQVLDVDRTRLAVGGFSDGASYALALGLRNAEVFEIVLAFSPGYVAPVALSGAPRVFLSHGVRDPVLPIDACSRRIAQMLRQDGVEVQSLEFDGPHSVPAGVVGQAMTWWLGPPRARSAPF